MRNTPLLSNAGRRRTRMAQGTASWGAGRNGRPNGIAWEQTPL